MADSTSPPEQQQQQSIEERRQRAFQSLRSLSSSSFAARSAAESAAAGFVFSPSFMLYFTLMGMFDARYPSAAPSSSMNLTTQTPEAFLVRKKLAQNSRPPQTFGALASAGIKYGVNSSARTIAWFAGTAALSATLAEVMQTGPRHDELFLLSPVYQGLCGLSGAATVAGVTAGAWSEGMGRARYGVLLGVGGILGVALPALIARTGPFVRAKIQDILGK